MKYPSIGASSFYRFSIPKLDGGVNTHDAVSQIEDNQLSDCKNMWFHDGALQTRPGLRWLEGTEKAMEENDGTPQLYGGTYDVTDSMLGLCRKFLEVADVSYPGSSFTAVRQICTLHIVSYDGEEQYKTPVSHGAFEQRLAFFVESGAGRWDGVIPGGAMAFFRRPYSETTEPHDSYVAAETAAGWTDVSNEIYIPHVLINGYPAQSGDPTASASGYSGEGFNMLTPKFKCTFTTDGKGDLFRLPVTGLDDSEVTITYIARGQTLEYSIPKGATESNEAGGYYFRLSRQAGTLYAADASNKPYAVALPDEGLKENVTITAAKTTEGSEDTIFGMTFCVWYGGGGGLASGTRLFISGNPDKPGLVHWSDVNKPLYFPENNYAYVGNPGLPITGFGKQGEKLVIFKEHEIYYTTYNAGTVTTDAVMNGEVVDIAANAAVFPIVQLHPSIGCDCPDTLQLCDNRLIWATSEGNAYCLSTTNALTETTVHLLSRNVERWLTDEGLTGYWPTAYAFDFAGHYILSVGKQWFALNYADSQFLYQAAYTGGKKDGDRLKWFRWEHPEDIEGENLITGTHYKISKGVLRTIAAGTKAIALCSDWAMTSGNENGMRMRYLADLSGSTDQFLYPENRYQGVVSHEIPCLFQTKLFDMGYPEQEKTVQQVYITASNRSQRTAVVTWLSSRGTTTDPYRMEQRETAEADSPLYMSVNRFTPLLPRVTHFGLRLESAGGISVGDIAVKYKRMGRCGR